MEADVFNPIFQHTVVFETALIFAVIILLIYERFIQSCPALFFSKGKRTTCKRLQKKVLFKSVLYYCKYVKKLYSVFTF